MSESAPYRSQAYEENLIADVKSAFPKWLMDLALLIQSEMCR